jgi:hypothetical protein
MAMNRRFAEARERTRTQAIQPDGTAVTAVLCDWFGRRCDGCGHTFREGDRVQVDSDFANRTRTVRHLDPALGCANIADVEVTVDDLTSRFHAAMDAAAPPPGHLRLDRLLPGDPLLRSCVERPDCPNCGETFRPFEVVVRCPCGEFKCQIALHRDPQRGLPCFDEVWPDLKVNYCHFRKRPVER